MPASDHDLVNPTVRVNEDDLSNNDVGLMASLDHSTRFHDLSSLKIGS